MDENETLGDKSDIWIVSLQLSMKHMPNSSSSSKAHGLLSPCDGGVRADGFILDRIIRKCLHDSKEALQR